MRHEDHRDPHREERTNIVAGWHRAGWAAFVALATSAGVAAQSSGFGPSWTYDSGSEGWIPKAVALGDLGGQVLMQVGPVHDQTRLFSSTDANPPVPLWQNTNPSWTYTHRVAAADETDAYVTLHDEDTTPGRRRLVLRRFAKASSTPQWTYTHPVETNSSEAFDVGISRDGRRTALVAFNLFTALTDVVVFGSSATPLMQTSLQMFAPGATMELSADGRRLYVSSPVRIKVIDTADGSELYDKVLSTQLFPAQTLSGDGSVFAYAVLDKIMVFGLKGDGTYEQKFEHEMPGPWYCNRADISDDGRTLACVYESSDTHMTARIVCLDLERSIAQGAAVETMRYDATGAGAYSLSTTAVELSADGSRFAVGLWGDEQGQAPEVLVFDRDQATPVLAHDLPGSVQAMDLSADGKRLAVASKAVHNNVFGGGGRIDLYDLEDADFSVHGVPHGGGRVRFELDGTPGSGAYLLASSQPAAHPSDHPGIGTIHINRKGGWVIPMGVFDANGKAAMDFDLGSNAVGTTLYFQGSQDQPAKLSESWVTLTVVP
jgi:hypothetical protein